MKRLLLIALGIGVCLVGNAQVNTPSGATWPFGARIEQFPTNPYDYGIIPSNLPAGAYNPASNQYGKSQQAYDAYVEWKNCYAVSCGTGSPTRWRIRFDNTSQSVSEGIAYGMLIAAYAADKNLFDGLWAYYKDRVNGRGVMNWRIDNGSATGCGTTASGTNGAADAEVDAAMALIVAECQWPDYTSPYDYSAEASTLISRIRQWEIPTACASGNMQLSNGDGWIVGCPANNDCRNPSYQAPAYFRFYQSYDGGAPAGFWNTLTTNSYTLLNANRNTTTGFVSNWSNPAGTMNTCAAPAFSDHGYDAIRNPWRMATEYLWWGTTQARDNFNQPISSYIRTQSGTYGSPNNLRGPVTLAGAHIGGRTTASPDATFTSMWATATMGVNYSANNQATLDFMYSRTYAVKDALNCTAGSNSGYFGNTLRIVSLFMMTGNFWKPCPPRCQAPAFEADSISTCGPNSVTLNSGLSTGTGRTFQWFKNNVSLGAASASATTLVVNASSPAPNGPGWFKVKVDTTGGCSQSDSIYVSSSSITPSLGSNIQLCDPSEITLDSRILGSGYTFVWEYAESGVYADLEVIPGVSSSTLTQVRQPGLYKVSAVKGGCVTKWDTITVTSQIVSPVDNCSNTAPASVTLSVTGPNLGAATNYDWYSVPTGGSVLSGGANTFNYTTPSLAAGTYTYYIQDKSRVYTSIGKGEPTSPPANCGSLSMNADGFTAGWQIDDYNNYSQDWVVSRTIDIDSVTVWYCLYNTTMPTITFQLTNANGSSVIQTTPARAGVRIVNPTGSYGPPYNGRIQGVRYYVGFTNVTAGSYRIKASTGSNPGGNMLLEQHPSNIAYSYKDNFDGVTASIQSSYGYSTTYYFRYAHFYDWTISAVNNCDRIPVYAYIGSCPVGLPVTLLNFIGKFEQEQVRLQWETAMEKDASHFEIQRSEDGENFVKIGTVSAVGNSNSIEKYSYVDPEPFYRISYYRLVMVDLNGEYATGHVISVERDLPGLEVFPNPSSTEITVALKGSNEKISCLTIRDLLGKEVLSITEEFIKRVIDVSTLPEGTYIITACYTEGYHAIRFVKKGE